MQTISAPSSMMRVVISVVRYLHGQRHSTDQFDRAYWCSGMCEGEEQGSGSGVHCDLLR